MSNDPAYFANRAAEELARAKACTDDKARRAHLMLAAEYAVLAKGHLGTTNDDTATDDRQTG